MRAKHVLALSVVALLSACSGGGVAVISTGDLCKSWRHQTVSKHDKITDGTASGIEGNNEARPAWGCKRGENRAS